MANRTPNPNRKEEEPNVQGQGGRMTESSPNPHGQAKVIQMPNPEQRREGRRNIPQSTSTTENVMNPSVTGPVEEGHEGLDDDSMFNSADPQVTGKNPTEGRPGTEGAGDLRRKDKKKKIG